jgi:hypothetical protein
MGLHLGDTPIVALYKGSTPMRQLYRGATHIWSRSTIRDSFDQADGVLSGNWTTSASGDGYVPKAIGNQCRLGVPDGLLSLALNTGRARYTAATLPGDDGYLEFGIGSKGSGPSITNDLCRTTILYRASDSANTHGVGIRLDSSTLRVVRRVSSSYTIMVSDCGDFTAGDMVHVDFVGDLHTVYCNGEFRGEWDDTGHTASSGSGFRSLMIEVQGSKDLLGPRRFGPTVDWVEMG